MQRAPVFILEDALRGRVFGEWVADHCTEIKETAMFIACGQDVAKVSESHAGIVYNQLLDNGDYWGSITCRR